ncbi:MAG: bifunctional glutamate N-acetyltransferase/amino-acid acetyltransferase ArgJ [Alphaproteobacteria bacterium]|nr:bifunctional glutamate N-acetyltransferase/amino-acid acetyltransferase ArgJ [Alphaproteobacteria bacterium]
MMTAVSPLAPKAFPDLPVVAGVRFAAHECGLRYRDRPDLLLAEMALGTTAAGVFTRSLTASAPVLWCREALAGGQARALVVNSGNSNAFTGAAGVASVERTVKAAAAAVGCAPGEVFVASTGTIGVPLDDGKITAALPGMIATLSAEAWPQAARAIMTTDTFPKAASRTARIGGVRVTIAGICKGSGMIAPDMATMLGYVFTDAKIPAPLLQRLLARGADRSFNAVTVDGDTSTSDTLMLFATGQANHPPVTDERGLGDFRRALEAVLTDLAHQIVRDGEGATKFVEIRVTGAASARAARRIGLAIGNSPLVKTAIAGEDANWGRVVMAVGKAGEKADRDRLVIAIGGVRITENGAAVPGYDEAPVVAHMKGADILIEVDVGVGRGRATVWTCDLTHGYIDINGSYRT